MNNEYWGHPSNRFKSSLLILLLLSVSIMVTGCGQKLPFGRDYDYEQELNILDDSYRNYYEIFVGSFYDSDGDGCGDLNGITQKLDYISDMGFNGIWLTPVFASPSYHKYDTTDYYAIDSAFGTNEDMEKLLSEAHDRGIRVVLDLVINHSSADHPWFLEACRYLRSLPEGAEIKEEECPYVSYYHFSKEEKDGYSKVNGADWYYESVFYYTQPDLNLQNEQVVRELEAVAAYWIQMGVDGFRMDAAMHFDEKDGSFNKSFLQNYYTYCRSLNPDFYMVSEVWASEATIASYYESMTDSFFNFDTADAEGKLLSTAKGSINAEKFANLLLKYQEEYETVNPNAIDAPFLTNHDMGRVANVLMNDADKMKFAGGLLLSMKGNPFVYYGEEIGMKSKGKQDENKRLAMLWSVTDSMGMTDQPQGADQTIESAFAGVKEQEQDLDSILNYYKRALRLRNENPELARGEISIEPTLTSGNIAVTYRTYEGSTIAVIYNTDTEAVNLDLTGTDCEKMTLRGYLTLHNEQVVQKKNMLSIPARSIVILKEE